ncbi:hypothetical protein PT2222_120323 [Paraburkholderia tropica]
MFKHVFRYYYNTKISIFFTIQEIWKEILRFIDSSQDTKKAAQSWEPLLFTPFYDFFIYR